MTDFRTDDLKTELDEQAEGLRAAAGGDQEGAPERELAQVILPTWTDEPDWIVGGRRARPGDFADCCAVGNEQGYFCTGTLIAPNVVVTAKHCPEAAPVTRVFLRGNDIDRPDRGETIEVTDVFLHPDPKVDLAVLVLGTDATAIPRPVAQGTEMEQAAEAMLVGFGTINLDGTVGYGIKRQVQVPIAFLDGSLPNALALGCRGDFEMVAGHRGLAKDSCRGDSGGPLYIRTAEGGFALLGATSRGLALATTMCGDGGIYVRVDRCLDWIREVTGADLAGPLL